MSRKESAKSFLTLMTNDLNDHVDRDDHPYCPFMVLKPATKSNFVNFHIKSYAFCTYSENFYYICTLKLRIMRAYTYMSKQEIDKSYFLTFCIEQFKQSQGSRLNHVRSHPSPLCLTALRTTGRREHQTLATWSHHAVWGGGTIAKSSEW